MPKLYAKKENNKFYTPKETVTKYWKYGDYTATWKQPALTSLTQYGEVVSTYGNNALKIFDNNVNTVYKVTGGSKIQWNFPEPLKISQVRLLGQYVSTKSRETNVIVYTEVNGVETKLATGSGAGKTTTYTSTANIDNVIVNNLIFKWSGFDSTVPPTIREIYITALERSVIEGTPDDYDFTTTQDIYYASTQGD